MALRPSKAHGLEQSLSSGLSHPPGQWDNNTSSLLAPQAVERAPWAKAGERMEAAGEAGAQERQAAVNTPQ